MAMSVDEAIALLNSIEGNIMARKKLNDKAEDVNTAAIVQEVAVTVDNEVSLNAVKGIVKNDNWSADYKLALIKQVLKIND